MSVKNYAVQYLDKSGKGGSTVGGGNAVISGAAHRLDGPEHLAPGDTTTLDASTSRHGLLPKIPALAGYRLDGLTGVWVPSHLGDLVDVAATDPTDQDVLTWDDYLSEWVPQAAAGAAGPYEDLTDVDMTGITDGQIPVWDSGTSTWIPGDASGVTDILDLPTAETDTALVMGPDGLGGVEFRAESGGSGSGALVLLEQHTASASASLDFTTAISSTYDTYLVELIDIIPATNAVDLLMRMSTDGGSTWDSSAIYSYVDYRWIAGGSAPGGGTGQNAIRLNNPTDHISSSSSWGLNGSLTLYSPGGATYKRTVAEIAYYNSAGNREGLSTRGAYESATAVDAFQFLSTSGNIASGTIRVYGMTK